MAKIKRDSLGLYMIASGYRSRPVMPSLYTEGDTVSTRHHGGSPFQGVGKNTSTPRGEYVETWLHDGYDAWRKTPKDPGAQAASWWWYRCQYEYVASARTKASAAWSWFERSLAPPWAQYLVVADPSGMHRQFAFAKSVEEASKEVEKLADVYPHDAYPNLLIGTFKRP